MKFDLKFFILSSAGLLAVIAALSFEFQIQNLKTALGELNAKLALLELKKPRERTVVLPNLSAPQGLKGQIFQSLYVINSKDSSGKPSRNEDASQPKRIRYLPNELLIQDITVVNEDAFFDLLGNLLDKDAVTAIELPESTTPTLSTQKIRRELLNFGVRNELLAHAKDGKFRVKLVDGVESIF